MYNLLIRKAIHFNNAKPIKKLQKNACSVLNGFIPRYKCDEFSKLEKYLNFQHAIVN